MNSLGESLRFVLSGFGGRQVLVVVWHPSVLKASPLDACSRLRLPIAEVIDNFHLHRPPMVWPSLGPQLARRGCRRTPSASACLLCPAVWRYYVRKESDAFFADFEGESRSTEPLGEVSLLTVWPALRHSGE